MKQRINIAELEPNAYQAMFGLEKFLSASSLDKVLCHLIRLRASQINGCAYCIEMHSEEALKSGESTKRLFALNAWWESPLFSEKEQAALIMTDEITHISTKGVSDETYARIEKHFNVNEITQLIMLIGTINTWNRIAVSTKMFHEKAK